MRVLKFGGTSMGDEHTWRRVLRIIERYERPVVVVSATARTTRQLIAAAEMACTDLEQALEGSRQIKERHQSLVTNFLDDISHPEKDAITEACKEWLDVQIENFNHQLEHINDRGELSAKQADAVASTGEQLSAYLFAQCGRAFGLPMRWTDARRIIKTDADFGQAIPDFEKIKKAGGGLRQQIDERTIPVIGGFYGENANGEITTLGFEGSDYTASLLGAAIQAQAVEIWTDVSGIYTCDPKVVKQARSIPELSFREATELAYFGAKVLHPATMKPAAARGIPVFVKNIFAPDHPGTKISDRQTDNGRAKAMTYMKDTTIVTITSSEVLEGHQFLAEVFKRLNESHTAVNAVTTTEASVSIALKSNAITADLTASFSEIGSVNRDTGQGLISLIGCSPATVETLSARIFGAIPEVTPSLISYSKAKQNFNIAVNETALIRAVRRIHDSLFRND